MPRVYVSIGSNIDREKSIRGAIRALRSNFGQLALSRVYESKAQDFAGDNFYNLVAGFESDHTPRAICAALTRIENDHGRVRHTGTVESRTLDIDLLLYGDLVVCEPDLKLPRPDITRYAFVLGPLAEIAPTMRHPETGLTFAQMWQHFEHDEKKIWIVDIDLSEARA